MPGNYFVAGERWDEVHEPGPRIPDPLDATKTIPGPSRLVAKIAPGEGRAAADVAQSLAEALNAVEIIEELVPRLPDATRNGPEGQRLSAAIGNVRRLPKP